MELRSKKLAIALAAMGLSGSALAAGFTPPTPAAPTPYFHVGVEGNLTHYDANSDAFAATISNPAAVPAGRFARNAAFDPDWEFGFAVNLGYHDGTGRDYSAEWTYLHNDDGSRSVTRGAGPEQLRINQPFGSAATDFERARGHSEADFDRVVLEAGDTFAAGNSGRFTMRVSGGAQFINFDHNLNVKGWNEADGVSRNVDADSCFYGIGIRAGFNAHMAFSDGFGAFVKTAVGGAYGDLESKSKVTTTDVAGATDDIQTWSVNDTTQLTPTLENKFGLEWTDGDWRVAFGWRQDTLFHVARFVSTEVTGNIVGNGTTDYKNYTNSGVFLAVSANLKGVLGAVGM